MSVYFKNVMVDAALCSPCSDDSACPTTTTTTVPPTCDDGSLYFTADYPLVLEAGYRTRRLYEDLSGLCPSGFQLNSSFGDTGPLRINLRYPMSRVTACYLCTGEPSGTTTTTQEPCQTGDYSFGVHRPIATYDPSIIHDTLFPQCSDYVVRTSKTGESVAGEDYLLLEVCWYCETGSTTSPAPCVSGSTFTRSYYSETAPSYEYSDLTSDLDALICTGYTVLATTSHISVYGPDFVRVQACYSCPPTTTTTTTTTTPAPGCGAGQSSYTETGPATDYYDYGTETFNAVPLYNEVAQAVTAICTSQGKTAWINYKERRYDIDGVDSFIVIGCYTCIGGGGTTTPYP